MQFAKLFNSILDSTIWREPVETKITWITMLAMCDRNGEVFASIPGLAARAGISIEQCEVALECLLSPDKYSRTKDHEGRRIAEIDGGWVLLNHGKYRALLSMEERKEYNRRKKAESRDRLKSVNDESKNVNDCPAKSAMSAHTDADAESDTKKKGKPVAVAPDLPFDSADFRHSWQTWLNYKKQKRQTLTEDTIRLQLKKLKGLGEDLAMETISHSIMNGWTGLFPPKNLPASRPITEQPRHRSIHDY